MPANAKGFAIVIVHRDGTKQWLTDPDRSIAAFPSHQAAVERRFEMLERAGTRTRLIDAIDIVPYPSRAVVYGVA